MDFVYLGKITGTHGVKGDVKVYPFAPDPERFKELKKVYIVDRGEPVEREIKRCRIMKDFVLLGFMGILDMNDAESIKGCRIAIDKKNIKDLPEGTHFVFDLINCRVFDENHNELGVVWDVLTTGANDVYLVQRDNKKDLLIPVLTSVIKKVDIKNKRIDVELPEGLLALYD